ncbi:MAG: 3-keto-5-aminohexanoate cleavage protein [Candidatus Calescibacterium sp.]|nr:3-keto-5-aminohexanoate cleavage protein [Candidatus Calescibacterium sp.]MCX7971819.1 3-keto-5-aminohexanoate cleavage protein [bacterium]MDW8194933.1 3-keto-5-aminohexanoate cleavage protein [Candidatus Calescibacterium sp.]
MFEPLVITVALVGAEVSKEKNPNLPITCKEIARQAIECYNLGATIAHIHVREEDGTPSSKVEYFQEVKELIEKEVPMIIQFTTGGAVGMTEEERMEPLKLKPHMATLNLGSMNFGDEVFLNTKSYIEKLALKMKELGIKPELEVYDLGMLEMVEYLVRNGYVDEPVHVDFVLGVKWGAPANIETLIFMVNDLRRRGIKFTWSAAAIGKHQLAINVASILLGGFVRTGLEDNIYYKKGVLATNQELVKRIVNLSNELGRPIATIEQAKLILGIRR